MRVFDDLANWFTHHAPQGTQVRRYELIRDAGRHLATVIAGNAPECADRTAAIRKVREAVMTANAAIACNEVGPTETGAQPVTPEDLRAAGLL